MRLERRTPWAATAGSPRFPRRAIAIFAALLVGLLVPASLRGGAAILLVSVFGLAVLQARAVGMFASAPRRVTSDPLTGLGDAAAFRRFVQSERHSEQRPVGILFLELRQLHLLRSTFGREAVETLCKTVATRLRRDVRSGDGLAHFGEGLFAVAFCSVGDRATFHAAAERLRDVVARPVLVGGTCVQPRWSAAAVLAPDDARTADELLAAAETAREMAATEGGEPLRPLPPASRDAAAARSRKQRELLEAAESGAFFPVFQPQLDLLTGNVERVEMLMRWQRTDGTVASPGAFLEELRELEALPQVSDAVYGLALAEAAAWRAAGAPLTRLAVNLDATQVADDAWAQRFLALIARSPLPVTALEVEVSENILRTAGLDRVVRGLAELRAAGVRVSLDDFGTGYASLTQIADLPIDLIKLDARLLWDAAQGERTRHVVEGVVALMRKLNLPCVFEGVETPAHLALARQLGARWAQGFLVGRPMTGPDLEMRLVAQRPEAPTPTPHDGLLAAPN